MLIKISRTSGRFDSIVEANEKGDCKALLNALTTNIATISQLIQAQEKNIERYRHQLSNLLRDLSELERIYDEDLNGRTDG